MTRLFVRHHVVMTTRQNARHTHRLESRASTRAVEDHDPCWRSGHAVFRTPDLLIEGDSTRSGNNSAGEILRALCGALAVQQPSGLADFDEIAVRVSHVAAGFRSPVDRRRDELRPFRL